MESLRTAFIERRSPRDTVETTIQHGLRQIVESIYGPAATPVAGLDIGRSYLGTSRDFVYGGDLVDVFHYGEGLTSIAVVDITGHGIAAAMHAGLVKHALRAYAAEGFSAVRAVQALNHLCLENSAFEKSDDFFATLFFAIIDRSRNHISYVSAGHDTACLIRPHNVSFLQPSGPVIGLLDDEREFCSRTVAVSPGDLLAIVTDGFTEARNADRVFLGSAALADVLLTDLGRSAKRSAEAITQRAFEYAQQQNHDDVAALVIKFG